MRAAISGWPAASSTPPAFSSRTRISAGVSPGSSTREIP